MSCPNINLEEWKLLVASRGEDVAYALWDLYDGNVPESESKIEIVKSGLKATNILQSPKADQFFNAVTKNKVSGDFFWKKMQADLGIPKDQLEILKSFNTQDRGELIASLLGNYSYAVEINTAKDKVIEGGYISTLGSKVSSMESRYGKYYYTDERGVEIEIDKNDWETAKQIFDEFQKGNNVGVPTQHYSNLTVPGGTNYTENEISTPLITPSIKGHAQFSTNNGIGWFRSDDKTKEGTGRIDEWDDDKNQRTIQNFVGGEATKTRRILEVQSDLFQKGRDEKKALAWNRYILDSKGNVIGENLNFQSEQDFLNLLRKDNNWVTFFIKSIIQDSAKKGYEKVLFPTGNTASKVEGHSTLEEFKKQKEDRIKELKNEKNNTLPNVFSFQVWDFKQENNDFYKKRGENNWEIITKEEYTKYFKSKYHNIRSQNDINTEISQLKEELERVETEGFGALKPIYNFYENTVKNVLNKQYGKDNVKQVTDEYGNTWNEINIVPEREQQTIFLQKEEMPASNASEETVNKIKELAKQAGISIQDLVDYAKGNPDVNTKNANGLADIIKGIIAIAQGKDSSALVEEYVHIASAIVEETNPELITALISKINRFKIYNQTLEAYKNNKAYQLPNGKPDIRKIKKEAVDKLISEVIIKQSEGSTEFPELMEEETRSMIREWWDAILDVIKGIYTKSNIELFETAAEKIASGQLGGTVSDITSEGVFFQQREPNQQVDDIYNAQKAIDDAMVLVPASETKKRHYTFNGEPVGKSVTEKHDDSYKFKKDRTDVEKRIDKAKMEFGNSGHKFIQDYITNNLIDEQGYARQEFLDEYIETDLSQDIQTALAEFSRELIKSYNPGTRFLIESMVINQKEKGMLGSTVDFKAIEPVEINGKKDIRVDTLDWKFTSLSGKDQEDIPWYKNDKWKAQMGEYVKMDRELGITAQQTRKARMVPFIASWEYNVPGVKSTGITLNKLEIGKLDSTKETKVYLLPVAIDTETTGNKKVDDLVKAFQNYYEKVYTMPFGLNKVAKNQYLEQLRKAIKQLHIQLNFEPIAAVGKQFLNNSAKALLTFKNIDYSLLSKEDIEIKLGELLQFKDSAIKFATIDDVYLSTYNKQDLDAEGKKTLDLLREISKRTTGMFEEIKKLQQDYVVHIALKSKLTTEETKLDVLNPEIEISAMAKTFLEGTKLSNRIINLASNLILKAKNLASIQISRSIDTFSPMIADLENQARKLGKSAFDLIGEERGGVLKLIKKLDQRFYDEFNNAIENEDKSFFTDNMDLAEYKKKADEYIKQQTEVLENSVLSTNEEENEFQIKERIKKLNSSLNIDSNQFDGFNDYNFKKFFKQSLKEEKFYSEQYKQLMKNDTALKVWNLFTGWNQKAYELGYLDDQGMAFLPLMEATLLQKFANSSDKLTEGKDFFDDLYKMRINEQANHSRIDPETGKVKKVIPKYFTRTDKAAHQLSKDLSRMAILYVKALSEYETSKNLENTLLTLHAFEQSKGTILTENGSIVYDGVDPKVDLNKHKSADMLQVIIDDSVYGLIENMNSIGNIAVSSVAGSVSANEEQQREKELSTKKVLENSNILIRSLAVGLKPLLAIANYFGYNFQTYINAGSLYRYDEDFLPNHGSVVTGIKLTNIEKALLDFITPLNDDLAEIKIRKFAKDQSYAKFLSTWTFSDVMMSTNSIPERALSLTHALSVLRNSILVDGKILNIRQYLKEQDRQSKYKLSEADRKALEKSFESRVKELKKANNALINISKIENNQLVVAGATDEELASLRVKILESGRNLSGQMSRDNKADFARDSILKSFMMFKTWIPKQIIVRAANMKKNIELDQWELGRTRAFLNVWNHLGTKRILEMREIINGTEKGLAIMDEILKEKKDAYFKRTGQKLDISKEEFYDLMRRELSNQMKELGLLFGVLGVVLAVKAAEPPEDEDALTKNRYKNLLKVTNKIADELSFYYNPLSFESVTKGSILPQIGLLSKAWTFSEALTKETYGYAVNDQEIIDKSYPIKYFLNLVPVGYQLQTEVIPFIDPELAKEMGIRVTSEARQR